MTASGLAAVPDCGRASAAELAKVRPVGLVIAVQSAEGLRK